VQRRIHIRRQQRCTVPLDDSLIYPLLVFYAVGISRLLLRVQHGSTRWCWWAPVLPPRRGRAARALRPSRPHHRRDCNGRRGRDIRRARAPGRESLHGRARATHAAGPCA